jgi:Na+-driven multidrug efflux pump
LIILAIGLVPIRLGFALGAYSWLKADALWLSFPISSLANITMAIAFYFHGGWKKARMEFGQQGPLDPNEAVEEALAECEPGGRLNPAG